MTGGWNRRGPERSRRKGGLVRNEGRIDEALERWLEGARFRRAADRAIRRHGLTFAQWRVLRAVLQLQELRKAAVSQHAVEERIEMDANTVSAVTKRLTDKGLVSWSVDDRNWAYRLLVTSEGAALLARVAEVVMIVASGRGFIARPSRLEVDDGGAAEGLDGDFGQELGVRDDADVGKLGLEELADVATDVGLGEHDDR
jgi:DNA-binding MarR family transcriptional regulator